MTKRLDLAALDLVSGGMDIRSLHAHIGATGPIGHGGSLPGAGGLGGTGGGPGFAPILPGHDPHDPGYGGTLYPGAHASPGLDPYAQGLGPSPIAAPPQDHSSHSFGNDLQAIASIANAFVGIIGAFTGHPMGNAPSQDGPSNGRVQTHAPIQPNDNGDQNDPGTGGQDQLDPGTGDVIDASSHGGGHTVDTGAVAENDGVGNHTNFHETDDGFVRG